MPVTIIIPGKPVPYARTGGGRGSPRFTPPKQRNEMAFIRSCAAAAMAGRPPIDVPVILMMCSVMAIPKSWPKKKRAAAMAGEIHPAARPDLSNLIKLVEDAFNAVVFVDDAQVVRVEAQKVYGPQAMTTVTVQEA